MLRILCILSGNVFGICMVKEGRKCATLLAISLVRRLLVLVAMT